MDKYEYRVRSEEIRSFIAQKRYKEAMRIADMIDWRRVKNVNMLCTISDLYKLGRRYEESRDILLLANDRRPESRTIIYSLCELSIKIGDVVNAWEFYKQYERIAPEDAGKYVILYKLYVAQDVSLEERIEVLEKLKEKEYREKWAYELAYLYHRVGFSQKCIEECDNIALWFGEGRYVTKAMELKMVHAPLSENQVKKYQETADSDIQIKTVGLGQYDTINLQRELAASMQEVVGGDTLRREKPEAPAAGTEEKTVNTLPSVELECEREIKLDDDQLREVRIEAEEDLAEETMSESKLYIRPEPETEYDQEASIQPEAEPGLEAEAALQPETGTEKVTEQFSYENLPLEDKPVVVQMHNTSPMPRILQNGQEVKANDQYDSILTQEYDGQLSFVVPEEEKVEKQITGQMCIDDVLIEWENIKKNYASKKAEENKKRVLKQTSDIFAQFDKSARKGVLEKLEAMAIAAEEEDRIQKQKELEAQEYDKVEEVFEAAEVQPAEAQEPGEPEQTVGAPELSEPEQTAKAQELLAREQNAESEELPEVEELAEIEDNVPEEALAETDEPDSGDEEAVLAEVIAKDIEAEEEKAEEDEEAIKALLKKQEEEEKKQTPSAAARADRKEHGFSVEEKRLFAPYIQTKGTRDQLFDALENVTLAAYTGNIILTGEPGMETVSLAKAIVKDISLTEGNFSGKMAVVNGKAWNRKNIEELMTKLDNGALIIEKAGDMEPEAVHRMTRFIQNEESGIIIILEDTKLRINRLLQVHEKLKDSFNLRVDVEAMNNDTLVAFAKKYALEKEYSIDELGILALHTRITDLQTSDHSVNTSDIKELVDEAILHVRRKNINHFFDVLFGKRYDEDDMIILREKDFSA